MGLVRKLEEGGVQIVFTLGETSNTIAASDIHGIVITQEELTGDIAQIVIRNSSGDNKSKFYEGWQADIQVKWDGDGDFSSFWKGQIVRKSPVRKFYKGNKIIIDCIDSGTHTLSGATTSIPHSYSGIDAGYIIEELIGTYTSLDTTNIDVTTGTTRSISITAGRNLLDVVRELTEGTGFTFRVDEDDKAYLIERGTVGAYTLAATQGNNFVVHRDVVDVKNDILVKGGYIDDSTGTSQAGPASGYWNIDNSANRRKVKFTPVGTVTKVTVTAYNPNTSTHNLVLRIQPDDGTGTNPIDITDYTKDLGRLIVPNSLIPTGADGTVGGRINALLVDDVDDYWLIVEGDAGAGNLLQVGYKAVTPDTLIHDAYSQVEITSTDDDATSKTNYGTREYTSIDRSLITQDECDKAVATILAEYKDAKKIVSTNLLTDIFSGVRPRLGVKVTVTLTEEDISAEAMGAVMIQWRFGTGVFVDMSISLATSSPPLTDADYSAVTSRKIDKLSNRVTTTETAVSAISAGNLPSHIASHIPGGGDAFTYIEPADVALAAAEGTATSICRGDHVHKVPVAAPTDIAAANAEGTGTSFCRDDHVHKHPTGLDADLHHTPTVQKVLPFMVVGSDGTNDEDYTCDGTADQVQINAAIDALSAAGGTVYLKAGNYYLSAPILLDQSGVKLFGSRDNGTLVRLVNGSNCNMITITGYHVAVDTIFLYASYANNSSGHGIYVNQGYALLKNVYVDEVRDSCIYINDNNAHVHDCWLDGATYSIYVASGGTYSGIHDNDFWSPCTFAGSQSRIIGNALPSGAAVVWSGNHMTVTGNTSRGSATDYTITGDYVSVTGNALYSTDVELTAASSYCTFVGNTGSGSVTNNGSNNVVDHNTLS